jgi:hypothetical protein
VTPIQPGQPPVSSSCDTAVANCAGAKGFSIRTLPTTPCDFQPGPLAPVDHRKPRRNLPDLPRQLPSADAVSEIDVRQQRATPLAPVAKGGQGRLPRVDRAGLETSVRQGVLDEAADRGFILYDQNTNGVTHFQVSFASVAAVGRVRGRLGLGQVVPPQATGTP